MAKHPDDEIIKEHRERMNVLARFLDVEFNREARGKERKWGFVLLVFPFGEASEGRCNYISNGADRRDIATLLKEMAARFEGQPEMKGRA